VALVAVEAVRAGLVPVAGLRVDQREHPSGATPLAMTKRPSSVSWMSWPILLGGWPWRRGPAGAGRGVTVERPVAIAAATVALVLTAAMDLHGAAMVAGIVIAAVIGRPVANPHP
jgi:hypothetical protein